MEVVLFDFDETLTLATFMPHSSKGSKCEAAETLAVLESYRADVSVGRGNRF